MSYDEQRAHTRRPVDLPVLVTDAGAQAVGTIFFDTLDLSAGGTFLRSELLLEVGEELIVEFELPGGRKIRAQAKVAHVAQEPPPAGSSGMGIAFTNLSDDDQAAVRAFLERTG